MGNFAVYVKDCWNFELHASMLGMQSVEYKMTISNDNPVKIHYNYTYLCKCLGNQLIKITTRFSGSDVIGQH